MAANCFEAVRFFLARFYRMDYMMGLWFAGVRCVMMRVGHFAGRRFTIGWMGCGHFGKIVWTWSVFMMRMWP